MARLTPPAEEMSIRTSHRFAGPRLATPEHQYGGAVRFAPGVFWAQLTTTAPYPTDPVIELPDPTDECFGPTNAYCSIAVEPLKLVDTSGGDYPPLDGFSADTDADEEFPARYSQCPCGRLLATSGTCFDCSYLGSSVTAASPHRCDAECSPGEQLALTDAADARVGPDESGSNATSAIAGTPDRWAWDPDPMLGLLTPITCITTVANLSGFHRLLEWAAHAHRQVEDTEPGTIQEVVTATAPGAEHIIWRYRVPAPTRDGSDAAPWPLQSSSAEDDKVLPAGTVPATRPPCIKCVRKSHRA